jgi:hypothetical protein
MIRFLWFINDNNFNDNNLNIKDQMKVYMFEIYHIIKNSNQWCKLKSL